MEGSFSLADYCSCYISIAYSYHGALQADGPAGVCHRQRGCPRPQARPPGAEHGPGAHGPEA